MHWRSPHAVQYDMLMRMPQLTAAIVHHGAVCSAPARAMPSNAPQGSCAILHCRKRTQQHVSQQPDTGLSLLVTYSSMCSWEERTDLAVPKLESKLFATVSPEATHHPATMCEQDQNNSTLQEQAGRTANNTGC